MKFFNTYHKVKVYTPDEEVYLLAKNIKIAQPSKKLSTRYLGPFKVVEAIGRNTYYLDLP